MAKNMYTMYRMLSTTNTISRAVEKHLCLSTNCKVLVKKSQYVKAQRHPAQRVGHFVGENKCTQCSPLCRSDSRPLDPTSETILTVLVSIFVDSDVFCEVLPCHGEEETKGGQ